MVPASFDAALVVVVVECVPDPAQHVVSSGCYGLIGEPSADPNGPQPTLYATNTIHNGDGSVFTFFVKFGVPEPIGDPIPGESTPPITFPAPGLIV